MKKSVFLLGTVSVLAAVQFFAPVVSAAVGSWSTNGNDMYYKDGKIGIGTMFPKSSLSILDNTNATNINNLPVNGNFANRIAPFAVGDINGTGKAILIDNNQIEQADNSDMYLNFNSSAKLILNQGGGNVGIGNTNPAAKLDVAGAVKWNNSMLSTDQGGAIELGGNNSVAGTGMPFVDFHHAGKTEDYSVRMINHTPRGLSLSIPSTNEKVDGVSIDVGSFQTMENAANSYYFRVRDVGGNGMPFSIRGDGQICLGKCQ